MRQIHPMTRRGWLGEDRLQALALVKDPSVTRRNAAAYGASGVQFHMLSGEQLADW